jgi:glutathione S-transferase
MSDELVFYTNPMSRGRIVRWMLEEVGRPYRTEVVAYGPDMKAPAYRAINPMGKVPALVHRGQVITESAAVCAYLADAFPDAGLAPPPTDPARAPYYRWLFFAAGPIEAAVTNASMGFEAPADKRGRLGYGSLADVLDTAALILSDNPYVAGDAFTAADVYFGSQIGFGLAFNTIEPRPAFQEYWSRISSRPAARRARELDDALMPAQA